MLLDLMIYVMTVSLLLGLAAWAFERAVRVFAFPTRWIWAGAMAGSDRATWTPSELDGRDVWYRRIRLTLLAGLLIAAQAASQEIRPQDAAAIRAGPVFTPMTVRPEIRNRGEAQQALMANYPGPLRDAGIGGRVVVWFYISETGQSLHNRVSQSSGQEQLDEAALRVATIMRFDPALDRSGPVAVWVEIPITFQVR